jgi:hypothetical protein
MGASPVNRVAWAGPVFTAWVKAFSKRTPSAARASIVGEVG